MTKLKNIVCSIGGALVGITLAPVVAFASNGEGGEIKGAFTGILELLLLSLLFVFIARKLKLPKVVGYLLVAFTLMALSAAGVHHFEFLKHNEILSFIAEFGVAILMFQSGLETNVQAIKKTVGRATLIALTGVVASFTLMLLFAYFAFGADVPYGWFALAFFAAAFVSTSVGVPAAVLNESQVEGKKAGSSTEASSILGAAVIDDILGLIVLTIFLQIIDTGSISALAIGLTIVKAVAFLVAAVLVGERLTAFFTKIFSKLGSHSGMRLVLSLAMMVALYKVAELVGLAGIIGAYAAGVLLDEVHYASFDHPDYVRHIVSTLPAGVHTVDAVKVSKHHLENILEEWGSLIVIPFFVLTIFKLDLSVLLSVRAIVFVLIAAIFAFLGKLTCGLVAGKVKNKLAVGIGMVTRTEVALIIVQQATASGRLAPLMTAVIVGVIVITMVLVPIFLKMSFKRGLTFAAA